MGKKRYVVVYSEDNKEYANYFIRSIVRHIVTVAAYDRRDALDAAFSGEDCDSVEFCDEEHVFFSNYVPREGLATKGEISDASREIRFIKDALMKQRRVLLSIAVVSAISVILQLIL